MENAIKRIWKANTIFLYNFFFKFKLIFFLFRKKNLKFDTKISTIFKFFQILISEGSKITFYAKFWNMWNLYVNKQKGARREWKKWNCVFYTKFLNNNTILDKEFKRIWKANKKCLLEVTYKFGKKSIIYLKKKIKSNNFFNKILKFLGI